MSVANRRETASILGVAVALAVIGGATPARAQSYYRVLIYRGFSYEEALLNRIEVTQSARPTDLANLARLVVLEAISMRDSVRRDLGNSPEGTRLLEQVDALWRTAANFDQMVSGRDPALVSGRDPALVVEETPQQAFADLNDAFADVQSSLGGLPGSSPITSYRIAQVTNLLPELGQRMAAIGPAPSSSPARIAAGAMYPEVRQATRLLAGRLVDLRALLGPADPHASQAAGGLAGGVDPLLALVQGFDRLLSGRPAPEDLTSVFRPVRLAASRVNAAVLGSDAPATVRNRWRAIREAFDGLSDELGLPRQIVLQPAPPATPPLSPAAIARLDLAVTEFDAFLDEASIAAAGFSDRDRLEDDARRLRALLFGYRQELLAGSPRATLANSLASLDRARRQLTNRVQPPGRPTNDPRLPRLRTSERILNDLRNAAN